MAVVMMVVVSVFVMVVMMFVLTVFIVVVMMMFFCVMKLVMELIVLVMLMMMHLIFVFRFHDYNVLNSFGNKNIIRQLQLGCKVLNNYIFFIFKTMNSIGN